MREDREARLEVGRLHVGGETPLEARAQPLLEPAHLAHRPVAGQDDLLAGLVERVEGVEELLLDALLASEELHVVDQQDVVAGAVALLELVEPLVAERLDELVRERLGGDVARHEVGMLGAHVLADRLQQVRLAEAGAAVDQERVVGLAGRLGDGQRRGVREAVRRADHERVERVLRQERRAAIGARRRLGRPRLGGDAGRRLAARAALDRLAVVADDGEAHLEPLARPRRGLADEIGEVPLDPRTRELVRHADLEIVACQADRASRAEPRREDTVRKVGA